MSDMQFRENVLAMHLATQAAVRAIITTHPAPAELAKALNFEGEESFSLLLGKRVSDDAIEAFRDSFAAFQSASG